MNIEHIEHIATCRKEAQDYPVTFAPPELPDVRQPISSVSRIDLAHDWALVELSEASVLRAQAAISKDALLQNMVLPTRSKSITADTDVMVIKGYSSISKGSISSSTTMMRLQPRASFQEVWTVRLTGDGSLGKCSKVLSD
jgi:hypothetical protein